MAGEDSGLESQLSSSPHEVVVKNYLMFSAMMNGRDQLHELHPVLTLRSLATAANTSHRQKGGHRHCAQQTIIAGNSFLNAKSAWFPLGLQTSMQTGSKSEL